MYGSRSVHGYPFVTHKFRRFIDFASPRPKDLDLLAAACVSCSAAFGQKNRDEPGRGEAGMDPSQFSTQLELEYSGLIRTIEDQLVQLGTEKKVIKAKLYKLNVQGDSCPSLPSPLSLFSDTIAPTQTKIHPSRDMRTYLRGRQISSGRS
jgi:hypothetical protein